MPTYQDQQCEGVCERLGHKCLRPDMFVRLASEYGAVPKEITGEFEYPVEDGQTAIGKWKYYALDVQGEGRQKALQDTAAKMHQETPIYETLEETITVVEQAFLQEFPCHLECDITICGYCGNQHEDHLIFQGGCEFMPAEEWGKGYE